MVREDAARQSLLSGGGLVLAVAAVLVFAAARQIDPAPARTLADPPAPPRVTDSLAPPAAAALAEPVAVEPARVLDPLSRRTLEDPMRLARAGTFTLQIAVACRKETALRLLQRAGDASELYVLPALSNGEECYRFCWGAFDGREPALRAALPAALRGADLGNPTPRRIEELTP